MTYHSELTKYKDMEKILKASRDIRFLMYKGTHISLAADLSTETLLATREL